MKGRLARLVLAAAMAIPGNATATGLASYWPHGAGSSWTYDRVEVQWGVVAKSRFDSVRFDLGATTTVGAGIEVQPLLVSGVAPGAERPALLRQLAAARCGTWAAMPDGGSSGVVIHDATLLRVDATEIGGYRADLGLRSWLYLEPDTSPGHTFELQLVPDVADSVFLLGRVVGSADVSTPAGSFMGALRVAYTVDYGWSEAVDEQGNPVGRIRSRTRGELFWAPDVGPVLARETFVPRVQVEGNPPPSPVDSTFTELRLQSWMLVPTGVATATWGDVKRRYR